MMIIMHKIIILLIYMLTICSVVNARTAAKLKFSIIMIILLLSLLEKY